MRKKTGAILAACALAFAATSASAQERDASYGMTRGEILTDGYNMAITGGAIGFGNKSRSFESIVGLLTRVSGLNQDISIAFWPPTVCGMPSARKICSFSKEQTVPYGARVVLSKTNLGMMPVSSR